MSVAFELSSLRCMGFTRACLACLIALIAARSVSGTQPWDVGMAAITRMYAANVHRTLELPSISPPDGLLFRVWVFAHLKVSDALHGK